MWTNSKTRIKMCTVISSSSVENTVLTKARKFKNEFNIWKGFITSLQENKEENLLRSVTVTIHRKSSVSYFPDLRIEIHPQSQPHASSYRHMTSSSLFSVSFLLGKTSRLKLSKAFTSPVYNLKLGDRQHSAYLREAKLFL